MELVKLYCPMTITESGQSVAPLSITDEYKSTQTAARTLCDNCANKCGIRPNVNQRMVGPSYWEGCDELLYIAMFSQIFKYIVLPDAYTYIRKTFSSWDVGRAFKLLNDFAYYLDEMESTIRKSYDNLIDGYTRE